LSWHTQFCVLMTNIHCSHCQHSTAQHHENNTSQHFGRAAARIKATHGGGGNNNSNGANSVDGSGSSTGARLVHGYTRNGVLAVDTLTHTSTHATRDQTTSHTVIHTPLPIQTGWPGHNEHTQAPHESQATCHKNAHAASKPDPRSRTCKVHHVPSATRLTLSPCCTTVQRRGTSSGWVACVW